MYRAALALGTANQLTNILRDVGEDAYQRNRIYVPLEELDRFKISEKEVSLPPRGRAAGASLPFGSVGLERLSFARHAHHASCADACPAPPRPPPRRS